MNRGVSATKPSNARLQPLENNGNYRQNAYNTNNPSTRSTNQRVSFRGSASYQGRTLFNRENIKNRDSFSSVSDVDEAELRDKMPEDYNRGIDDQESDLSDFSELHDSVVQEEFKRSFAVMDDNSKLKTLAEKAQELYRKAKQFDNQMISLNRQYNFLDRDLKYEENRMTDNQIPGMIRTQVFNLTSSPSSK